MYFLMEMCKFWKGPLDNFYVIIVLTYLYKELKLTLLYCIPDQSNLVIPVLYSIVLFYRFVCVANSYIHVSLQSEHTLYFEM